LELTLVVQYQQSSVCVVTHGLPAGQVLVRVLVWLAEQALQADQAPQALFAEGVQTHGVPQDGYATVLQLMLYPEPLLLIFSDSSVKVQPAQLELTLCVQYQIEHASV